MAAVSHSSHSGCSGSCRCAYCLCDSALVRGVCCATCAAICCALHCGVVGSLPAAHLSRNVQGAVALSSVCEHHLQQVTRSKGFHPAALASNLAAQSAMCCAPRRQAERSQQHRRAQVLVPQDAAGAHCCLSGSHQAEVLQAYCVVCLP
jgi:hypothetical protein